MKSSDQGRGSCGGWPTPVFSRACSFVRGENGKNDLCSWSGEAVRARTIEDHDYTSYRRVAVGFDTNSTDAILVKSNRREGLDGKCAGKFQDQTIGLGGNGNARGHWEGEAELDRHCGLIADDIYLLDTRAGGGLRPKG